MARALLLVALTLAVPLPQAARANDLLFPVPTQETTPLQMTLRLPLGSLLKARPSSVEKLAGQLELEGGVQLSVNVSPRGKSRREHCSFPPLWLDFKKKNVAATIFAGQNKLKLVTHCSSRFASREFLATEMLTYRLFGLFTDYSFRVRALEVTYVDTERDRRETRFAFLIEHKKRLADRLGAEVFETPGITIEQLEPAHATLLGLFQFMIGNTDFSMRKGPEGDCCHNAVPLLVGGPLLAGGMVRPVPYDFDVSGLVNPPYAAPSPNLSIRRVTQRLYRGYCRHNELLPDAVRQFVDKKSAVFATVNDFDDIPGLKRARLTKYLTGFFDVIESARLRQSKLLKRCL